MTNLVELRELLHTAIDEHTLADVINEFAIAIVEHAEDHVRRDQTGRGTENWRAKRLDLLSVTIGRLSLRATKIGSDGFEQRLARNAGRGTPDGGRAAVLAATAKLHGYNLPHEAAAE